MRDYPPHQSDLQRQAANLVSALGGVWREHGSMCRCPAHPDRTPSLSVRVGTRSLLFKCFAGCETADVLRAIRQRRWHIPVVRLAPMDSARRHGDEQRRTARARRIWREARALSGTPAQLYLQRRGITLVSRALRFHPRTPLGSGANVAFHPAMIAAVTDGEALLAVQRLFLDIHCGRLAGDLPNPKRTLGRSLAGSVRLQPAGPILGLAEGVETALSASILLGIPVWAALGNERLSRLAIPACVRRLILLPDNDRAGRVAAARGQSAYAARGLTVQTWWPWGGCNDWNDLLQAEEEAAGERLR